MGTNGRSCAERLNGLLPEFSVGQVLGRGARSIIFELTHRETNDVVAVKYVPVERGDDLRVIGHLENEWDVLCALHARRTAGEEHIVDPIRFRKVRRLFRVRGAYLMMERVFGRSLYHHTDYALPEVLEMFRHVCEALEHIHSCGYVHADLKPHNILVQEDLTVKLIDFGFAAPIGAELSTYKGTLGYLAPEQAGGRLTDRTDVFNLGAALYRVLTGHNVPYLGGNENQEAFVPDEAVPLQPLFHLNPDVPPELSGTVLRCCSFHESERPSVQELGQYLHGLQLRIGYGMV
jgi:serine/threonine-protein kinase